MFSDDSDGTFPIGDAGPDARLRDGSVDGEPIEDALPPLDVRPPQDVNRIDCPDAAATLVYLISNSYELYSFDPENGAFLQIGSIACPSEPGATPFSMAVDRRGIAYILFTDDHIYQVSTATAACIGTAYTPGQSNFRRFGMGFATNDVGPTETLYVSGDEQPGNNGIPGASGLARIDKTSFALSRVGQFNPLIRRSELTGTGDGRLFALYNKFSDTPSFIGEIDTDTAVVKAETAFPSVALGSGWAFAFWGGDFYMFTAPGGGGSTVTRFRPSDSSVTVVGSLPTIIVGAGVSTCAPQQ